MKNIIVIDDDHMILDSVKRQLKNQPYEVDFESNPVTALDRIEGKKYDLVLCDMIMMPISGVEVLDSLRKNHPDIPVIVLTGYVDDKMMDDVKEIGCDDFLIKPIRKTKLIESINKIFNE
jgi:two-component system phosphoglycerate transport system response regulator PgtA